MTDEHDPIDDWLAARLSLLKIGPRRSLLFYAIGATVGLLLAGFALFTAKGTSVRTFPPEDVALVNGRHILRSDFITQTEVETSIPFAQTTAGQRRKVLNEMIDEELLVQRGLEVDLAATDPDVRTAMVAGVNLQVDADVISQQPSDAELKAFYQAHLDKYSTDGVMRIRDLVMPLGTLKPDQIAARAKDAARDLAAGGPTPAVLQRYALKDSGLIDQDDNFDFAVKAKLGDDIYKAVKDLKPGEVSVPVSKPDGEHIVVMVRRINAVSLDFDKAKDNVWQDFKRQARDKVEGANLKYLKSRAEIELAKEFRGGAGK